MIGFLRWLRGTHSRPDLETLDAQAEEARAQRVEARDTRKRAEDLGPVLRRRVEENHISEGFALAFAARDRQIRRERHA